MQINSSTVKAENKEKPNAYIYIYIYIMYITLATMKNEWISLKAFGASEIVINTSALLIKYAHFEMSQTLHEL